MTTKLTLSIEKETIKGAKILSSKTGKSISKIVESYLNSLLHDAEKEESAVEKLSESLNNIITENLKWKEVKTNYLNKKYGI